MIAVSGTDMTTEAKRESQSVRDETALVLASEPNDYLLLGKLIGLLSSDGIRVLLELQRLSDIAQIQSF